MKAHSNGAASDALLHSRSRSLFVCVSRKARLTLAKARLASPKIGSDELLALLEALFVEESREAGSLPSTSHQQKLNDAIIKLALADVLLDDAARSSQSPIALDRTLLSRVRSQSSSLATSPVYLIIAFIVQMSGASKRRSLLRVPSARMKQIVELFSEGLGTSSSIVGSNANERSGDLVTLMSIAADSENFRNPEGLLTLAVNSLMRRLGEVPQNRFLTLLLKHSGLPLHQLGAKTAEGVVPGVTKSPDFPSPTDDVTDNDFSAEERCAESIAKATVILNQLVQPRLSWSQRVSLARADILSRLSKASPGSSDREVWASFYAGLFDVTFDILAQPDNSPGALALFAALPHLFADLETFRLGPGLAHGKDASADGLVASSLTKSIQTHCKNVRRTRRDAQEDEESNETNGQCNKGGRRSRFNAQIKSLESLNMIRASQANSLYLKPVQDGENVPPQNLLQQLAKEAEEKGEAISSLIATEYLGGEAIGDNQDKAHRINELFMRLNDSFSDMLAAREVASAIIESFRISTTITTASLDNIALVCTALMEYETALSNVLLFRSAHELLQPLVPILDDEETFDHLCGPGAAGDDEPAMLSRTLLFIQRLSRQMAGTDPLVACSPSITLIVKLHADPTAPPLFELDAEHERPLISRWIKELFDSDGVGDELIKDSPPRILLKLSPVLFSQSITAAELSIIDAEMLRNGLSFFLQDLLSYTLPGALDWLMEELRRCKILSPYMPFHESETVSHEPQVSALARRSDLLASVLRMLLLDESCPAFAFRMVAGRLQGLLKDGVLIGNGHFGAVEALSDLEGPMQGHPGQLESKISAEVEALKSKLHALAPRHSTILLPSSIECVLRSAEDRDAMQQPAMSWSQQDTNASALRRLLFHNGPFESQWADTAAKDTQRLMTIAEGSHTAEVRSTIISLLALGLFAKSVSGNVIEILPLGSDSLCKTFASVGLDAILLSLDLLSDSKQASSCSPYALAKPLDWTGSTAAAEPEQSSHHAHRVRWNVLTDFLLFVAQFFPEIQDSADDSHDAGSQFLRDLLDDIALAAWRWAGRGSALRGNDSEGTRSSRARKDSLIRLKVISDLFDQRLGVDSASRISSSRKRKRSDDKYDEATESADLCSQPPKEGAEICGGDAVSSAAKRANVKLITELHLSLQRLKAAALDVGDVVDFGKPRASQSHPVADPVAQSEPALEQESDARAVEQERRQQASVGLV